MVQSSILLYFKIVKTFWIPSVLMESRRPIDKKKSKLLCFILCLEVKEKNRLPLTDAWDTSLIQTRSLCRVYSNEKLAACFTFALIRVEKSNLVFKQNMVKTGLFLKLYTLDLFLWLLAYYISKSIQYGVKIYLITLCMLETNVVLPYYYSILHYDYEKSMLYMWCEIL